MSNVIFVDFGRGIDSVWLTKRQLSQRIGYSTRWIEQRMRLGMPSIMDGNKRKFNLAKVEEWMDEQEVRSG